MQLASAYNDALRKGRLTSSRGSIVQSTFLASLNKRIQELLEHPPSLRTKLHDYFRSGKLSGDGENSQDDDNLSTLVSWYLQWYNVPPPSVVKAGINKLKSIQIQTSSLTPLLRLLFPGTHINAISEIDKFLHSSSKVQ